MQQQPLSNVITFLPFFYTEKNIIFSQDHIM